MDEIMSWEECKKRHIIKIEPDLKKVQSIINACDLRLEMVPKHNDKNTFLIVETYYEIIKELLMGLLLLKGLKSRNHECLISFFKNEYKDMGYESEVIHLLKDIRNSIQYEGKLSEKEYLLKNKLEFEHIKNFLRSEISKHVDIPREDKSVKDIAQEPL